MKKLVLFILLYPFSALLSQTVLNSHALDLKKNSYFHQILNVENTNTHQVFVFASDKENTTILKYNSSLFFSDSIKIKNPNKRFRNLSGYRFKENENPVLFWSTPNLKEILGVEYNLKNKEISSTYYTIPFKNEIILNTFCENNSFFILSLLEKEEKLKIYLFKDGETEERIINFSEIAFANEENQALTLNEVLIDNPIEIIEYNSWNPLFKSSQKSKMYVLENKLIITLDYNSKQTQTFTIDLTTFETKEHSYSHFSLKKQNSAANSFLQDDKLYQIKNNKDELIFSIKDFNSDELIKKYSISEQDSTSFKNSPFYFQKANQEARKLNDTKKFLERLLYSNSGLSVYKTRNNLFITIGGNSLDALQYATTFGFYDYSAFESPVNVFFETVLDSTFNPVNKAQGPIAVDFISQFVSEHKEVKLESSFRFKGYTIFGYYDAKAKMYILRKFTDENPY
jgi:hypothetical protein